ncbi:phosphatidylinositol 3,4,5-trisphosphate 3-phosphatase and dual-specificity protein phosphatase PTEN isoform X2 [Bradysia coprophila]|nr:phosphatidylinositol 3,4,5-trisphosphate 3-phosphatase and dual-specificity protein phosphatase PTEN isoform X2 [Bradysia coprophila]
MANIMSSMKNPIKKLVSKQKKRYTEGGFDLDLSYILPNLIAMGFPAVSLEGVYRNHIDHVVRFFKTKHDGAYKIYNLCSERDYDIKKFDSRVEHYPFHDHNPPNIEQIQAFCDDVHKWLNENENNVAAVHCKAGKGRTGTMICCYMLYSKQFDSASEALSHFSDTRTHDKKGVTIPSQRRYVEYYARLLKSGVKEYRRNLLQLKEIKLSSPPSLNSHQGTVHFSVSSVTSVSERREVRVIHTSEVPDCKKSFDSITIPVDPNVVQLSGDIKIEFYSESHLRAKKKKVLFRFWFNTYFVELENAENNSDTACFDFTLSKNEIDCAHKDKKDKIYPSNFKVQLALERFPNMPAIGDEDRLHKNMHSKSMISLQDAHTPSENTEASSSGSSSSDGWESGEFYTIDEHVERPKQRKINKIKSSKTNVIATKQPQQFKAKSNNIKIKNNNGIRRRWLSSTMRSDPDFCEIVNNVNFRIRHSNDNLLDVDYYSKLCDNQLSVGSPCKSPSELLIKSNPNQIDTISNNQHPSNECDVLVVAKPIESQAIGFKVDDNHCFLASEKLPSCDNLCSKCRQPAGSDTAKPNSDDHHQSATKCDHMFDKTKKKQLVSTSFRPRFFQRNVSSKKLLKEDVPSLCVTTAPSLNSSSFQFDEIRNELQSVIRENSVDEK